MLSANARCPLPRVLRAAAVVQRDEKGWPLFEEILATLHKSPSLDSAAACSSSLPAALQKSSSALAAAAPMLQYDHPETGRQGCVALPAPRLAYLGSRAGLPPPPPLSVERFTTELRSRKLARRQDRELLLELYAQAAVPELANKRTFAYRRHGWSDQSIYELSLALRDAPYLCAEVLDLKGNPRVSRVGLESLTKPASRAPLMDALKTLNLSGCKALVSLPEWLARTTSLQTLVLASCSSLASLPDWLPSLERLQTLDLSYCAQLTGLPTGLGRLRELRTLDLYLCSGLTALPAGLALLTKLSLLNLTYHANLVTMPDLSRLLHLIVRSVPPHLRDWDNARRAAVKVGRAEAEARRLELSVLAASQPEGDRLSLRNLGRTANRIVHWGSP